MSVIKKIVPSNTIYKSSSLGIHPNTNIDISNKLNSVINSLPNRSTFILESGHYLLNSNIEYQPCYYAGIFINNKSNINIIFDNVTITQPYINYRDYSLIVLSNCRNINIQGINSMIEGNADLRTSYGDTYGEWGHGFNIISSKNITLDNLTIKSFWGDCIYITDESSNISISNCKLHYGRRWCFTVICGSNIYLTNCELIYKKYSSINYLSGCFDLEQNSDTETIDNIYIYNNKLICENTDYCVCGGGMYEIGKVEFVKNTLCNVVVKFEKTNSLIDSNYGLITKTYDPCKFSGDKVIISNNTFFVPENDGYISFDNINSLIFTNNTVDNTTSCVVNGLIFNDINNLNLTHNVFNNIGGVSNATTSGCINLSNITYSMISDNNFNCHISRCILLNSNCENIIIRDNSMIGERCVQYTDANSLNLFINNNYLKAIGSSFIQGVALLDDSAVNVINNTFKKVDSIPDIIGIPTDSCATRPVFISNNLSKAGCDFEVHKCDSDEGNVSSMGGVI